MKGKHFMIQEKVNCVFEECQRAIGHWYRHSSSRCPVIAARTCLISTGMSVRNRRRNTLPIIAEPTVPITVDDCRGSERHASLYLLRDVPFFGTVSSLTRRSSISSWVKLVHVWFLTHMHGIMNMRTAGLGVVSPSEICESIRFRKLMLSEQFFSFSQFDR